VLNPNEAPIKAKGRNRIPKTMLRIKLTKVATRA
jgi:hypothetical protein